MQNDLFMSDSDRFGSFLRIKVIARQCAWYYRAKISATRSFVRMRGSQQTIESRDWPWRTKWWIVRGTTFRKNVPHFPARAIATAEKPARVRSDRAELLTVSCACHISNVCRFIILTLPPSLSNSYVARNCHNRRMIRRGISVWLFHQAERRR